MEVKVPKGKYVIAVSGGVDSMALLDVLSGRDGLELVVAHFNHGMRPDSVQDEILVKQTADNYDLVFESAEDKLDKIASEEAARNARYFFLEQVRASHHAQAIIAAHHQDDLIETAFINVLRGTGRLGLSSMSSNKKVLRPLLAMPKAEILAYAMRNKVVWREDTTNRDTSYLRNYLRLKVLPKLTEQQREYIVKNLDKVAKTNEQLTHELAKLSQFIDMDYINRSIFSSLPANIGAELLAQRLREKQIIDFDADTIGRLSMAIKTSKPNSKHPIKQRSTLLVGVETASFVTP